MSTDPMTYVVSALFDTTLSLIGSSIKQKAYQEQERISIRDALENRRMALYKGRVEAEKIRKKGRLLEGIDMANIGASGITLSGSALDVIMQNTTEYEQDAEMALYNANLIGNSYLREGYNKAAAYANASAESSLNALTGSAGSIFNNYSKYQQSVMKDNQLSNEKANISALNDLVAELRETKNKNYYGTFYSIDGIEGDFNTDLI